MFQTVTSLAILALIVGTTYGQKGSWTPPDGWTPPAKGTAPSKDGWTPPSDWTPPSGGPSGGPGKGGNGGGSGGSGGTTEATEATTEGTTTTAVIPEEQPTEPTACTDANAGRCECADTADGFQTYTFWLGDVQRCFTVFHPPTRDGALPVVLAPNCYAQDRLSGIEGLNGRSDGNAAASRFGFARIGLSTPDGAWNFANDGVINNENPMPCSEEDSKDIPYLQAVFDFIDANPEQFDASKIYALGFSQNSMFSAYIGFCFHEKVLAIWQGGSGMAYTGVGPNLPGCQGQVKASVFAECQNDDTKCSQCMEESPCEECQYWPIYPCYSASRPMVDCLAVYDNDNIAVEDPDTSNSATYMYDKLVAEGHDARLFRFSAPEDGTINGGHSDPKNKEYWQVGCMGITAPCSDACEAAFLDCVASQGAVTASDNVEAFETCIDATEFNGLDDCDEECAPTFAMLAASEMPTTIEGNNFGAGSDTASDKPSSSICDA